MRIDADVYVPMAEGNRILKLGMTFDLSMVSNGSLLSLAIYNKIEQLSFLEGLYTRQLSLCLKIGFWTLNSGRKWFVPPTTFGIDNLLLIETLLLIKQALTGNLNLTTFVELDNMATLRSENHLRVGRYFRIELLSIY